MNDNNKNFILALTLSVLVFFVWHFFYVAPKQELQKERARIEALKKKKAGETPAAPDAEAPIAEVGIDTPIKTKLSRNDALKLTTRIEIETSGLNGSLSLKGARIDDLSLKHHRKTVKKDSGFIELLSPVESGNPYFAEFGWAKFANNQIKTPTKETIWKAVEGEKLTPNSPVTLEYDNGQGLIFRNIISVDEEYMFSFKQQVINKGDKVQTLTPYGRLWRKNRPESYSIFISHEGGVGVINDELVEIKYDDLTGTADSTNTYESANGWIGLTDKYWATALVPDPSSPFKSLLSIVSAMV